MRQANSPPLRPDQRRLRAFAALAIVALLAVATVAPLAPPSILPGWPKCLLRNATGLPCPFCGGTRAAQSLLRGDFSRALYLNAIAFPVVFAVIAVAAVLAGEAWRARPFCDWEALLRRVRPFLPAVCMLICIYWMIHLGDALRGRKPELVDLRNPVARRVYESFFLPR
ncbi:MAG TPA: DUF2752 domain-containing protein [Terrimicrobiaceae bacterium]|nr:DUF2752 domain-containing protein [Terrimicrobiaceae bacterium]